MHTVDRAVNAWKMGSARCLRIAIDERHADTVTYRQLVATAFTLVQSPIRTPTQSLTSPMCKLSCIHAHEHGQTTYLSCRIDSDETALILRCCTCRLAGVLRRHAPR